MVRVAVIEAGSAADGLGLEIGSRIVKINGERVRDNIDLNYLLADAELTIESESPAGVLSIGEVVRVAGEPFGLAPEPDTVRECANECVFCFIDGNPPKARSALSLRDDDFRLSFTYGSYVTLTNLGPKGIRRLVEQGISPLYVSVHATEPEVRERLLVNRRAGLIMDQLAELGEGGVEVHAQIVLCPGWNDGEHLDRTIEDLWGLGTPILSLSVVPVGLTRYNISRPVRLLSPREAARAIDRVDAARARALRTRDFGWCYAADELYIIAGRSLPGAPYYDGGALEENGVGSVRAFLEDFDQGLPQLPALPGRRLRLVTGSSMAPFLREKAPALARSTGADVVVAEVENRYFGESVTTAGLLGGRDVLATLGSVDERDVILLPADSINEDGLFIDDISLATFTSKLAGVPVSTGRVISDALGGLPRFGIVAAEVAGETSQEAALVLCGRGKPGLEGT